MPDFSTNRGYLKVAGDLSPTADASALDRRTELHPLRKRLFWAFGGCLVLILTATLSTWLAVHEVKRCPYDDVERCELLQTSFRSQSDVYSVPKSPASDHAWRGLFPAEGAVFANPPEERRHFTLTVLHQLHCLASIRLGFFAAKDGQDLELVGTSDGHIQHCIDFLRQSVMCYGDTTVEFVNNTSGYGIARQCRSWDQIIERTGKWNTVA